MTILYSPPKGQTWRDLLQHYQAAQDEYNRYSMVMTQYERSVFERELVARRERALAAATAGVIADFNLQAERYKSAQANLQAAKESESRRWAPEKFLPALDQAKRLTELALGSLANDIGSPTGRAGALEKLEAMRKDAERTGDIHQRRAVLEVLRGLTAPAGAPEEVRRELWRLSGAAERDLKSLRQTAEMDQAELDRQASAETLLGARRELETVYRTFNAGELSRYDGDGAGALGKAWRRVAWDSDNNLLVDPQEVLE